LAAKLRGASVALLIYDLYPEALVMAGLVQPGSLVARTIRVANGILFGALDAIITIGATWNHFYLTTRALRAGKLGLFRTGRCYPSDIARLLTAIPSGIHSPTS